jgi:hypothetical protein
MSELEDLIRDVCSRGELTHLSLSPRKIERGENKFVNGWGATFSPASVMGNTFGENVDPVEALKSAIEDAKLRRKAPFADGDGAKPVVEKPQKRKKQPEADLSDLGL